MINKLLNKWFGGKDNLEYKGNNVVDGIQEPLEVQTPLKIGYMRPQSVLEHRQRVNVWRCSALSCDAEPTYFDDMKNGYCEHHFFKLCQ